MKILLVRLSSMGDLIHTLPAINDLSIKRPDIELDWLCESAFSDITKLHPFIKKTHTIKLRLWKKKLLKKQTWNEIKENICNLRDDQYKKILESQGLLKSAIFSKYIKIPVIGLDSKSARERIASIFYNEKINVDKNLNAIKRNRILFSKAFNYTLPEKLNFGLELPDELNLNINSQKYIVALHATSKESKFWPIENWKLLFKQVHKTENYIIYLPWGNQQELDKAKTISKGLENVVVCDKMSLLHAAKLLKDAEGVVGVDTGLLHLANAVDTPLVGIYTDTDPNKTGVQESDWAVNIGGVNKIPSVEAVYTSLINNILSKRKKYLINS